MLNYSFELLKMCEPCGIVYYNMYHPLCCLAPSVSIVRVHGGEGTLSESCL